jgi:hypothetical protein
VEQTPTEEPLLGGNAGATVVRVGDTVRRPAQPWSRSVDALLEHFASIGLEGTPRSLGYDDLGRQMLSYVEGCVDPDPSDLDLARLFQVGELVRQIHDGAESFHVPPGAEWNVLIEPDGDSLICHHDLAPWNLVRTKSRLTFIDWDGAGPGSRLWDLAYAVHGFVPLSPRSGLSDDESAQRLRALVDGYGLVAESRLDFVLILGPRIRSMYEFLRESHASGFEPWSSLWLEGHGNAWLEDADYTDDRRIVWQRALI